MSDSNHAGALTGESLLRVGRSWKVFAITLIVVLSAGMTVISYGQLRQSGTLAEVLESPERALVGFGFLMLLTVGYLVGKSFSTTRYQRRLIDHLLQEEVVAHARRLNPMTQFHHPEVCRDLLCLQAGHAARLQAPLSLVELTVSNLEKLSGNANAPLLADELIQQIQQLCRPMDALLRWSPNSFLMVFPEVTESELETIRQRIQPELENWCQMYFDPNYPLELHWKSATTDSLDPSGDVLVQVGHLLEKGRKTNPSGEDAAQAKSRCHNSVGLALSLQVQGVDELGNPFQDVVVTERVAADRVWFVLNRNLAVQKPLTVTAPDGAFQETAVVRQLIERGEDQVVEVKFPKAPDHWVVRAN